MEDHRSVYTTKVVVKIKPKKIQLTIVNGTFLFSLSNKRKLEDNDKEGNYICND